MTGRPSVLHSCPAERSIQGFKEIYEAAEAVGAEVFFPDLSC